MTTAQKILAVYGVVILGYGFGIGVPLALARSSSALVSRHLVTTHLSALMQGPIHLGLGWAIGAVGMSETAATVAAVLLVVGSAGETLGGTANWLRGTNDQFAEKSLGWRFNAASSPLLVVGIAIVVVGVLSNV
ncbi:MAG TPA: hypothetical protein VL769_03140 [Acidimicrobiia bacterium]|jgi:hypothetical protein|nr:hypothetical protein [Acidimicrobiia bacterium]